MTKFIIIIIALALIAFLLKNFSSNKKLASENIEKGNAFLEENKNKEGVITTVSGLQYLILNEGTGTEKPGPKDFVKVHYHGTLLDGTVFDSSVERGQPIDFGLHQVIPGWTEGLQLMVVGQKVRLFIPSKLGYGNRSMGVITPGSTLIFDVELLEIIN